jgi:hypothetical protein
VIRQKARKRQEKICYRVTEWTAITRRKKDRDDHRVTEKPTKAEWKTQTKKKEKREKITQRR